MTKLTAFLVVLAFGFLWSSQPVDAAQTLVNPPSGSTSTKTLAPNKTGVPDDSIRNGGRSGVADDSVRTVPPLNRGPQPNPDNSGLNSYPNGKP